MHYIAFKVYGKAAWPGVTEDQIDLTGAYPSMSWFNTGTKIHSYHVGVLMPILKVLAKHNVVPEARREYRLPKPLVSEIINELRKVLNSEKSNGIENVDVAKALDALIKLHLHFNYEAGHLTFWHSTK